jgi:hypothetical protein
MAFPLVGPSVLVNLTKAATQNKGKLDKTAAK